MEYIRSIKQLEKFDKTKDIRRNIELKKYSDNIDKIPTDVQWEDIDITHCLAKSIPTNLFCKRLRMEDNPVITTISTNASIVIVSKCHSLKKIIAPNCHTLVIDNCDNMTSIPENNYIMYSYFGNNSNIKPVPIPKNGTIDKITVHRAIIKKDIVATDSICLKDCKLDKKNIKLSGKDIYIDKVKHNDSVLTVGCTKDLYINESDLNISKKSNFENIIATNSIKKSSMSYDFISGRTLGRCIIVDYRSNVAFPENLTIIKTVKSIGLIAPKNIKINDFANIWFDENWTHIPGHKKNSVYSNIYVSYDCAGSMKNIISTGMVHIDIINYVNKKIKLNTLICNHLTLNASDYSKKYQLDIEIPREHVIFSKDGSSDLMKNMYYKCDDKKINANSSDFVGIIWNDLAVSRFTINDRDEIILKNLPIPKISGIYVADGISMFFTSKKVMSNRTIYMNSTSNHDKHFYYYNGIRFAISEVQPDKTVINSHGHSYRDMIDSFERKKNSHYNRNTTIIDMYKNIPKDMPLEKDFCIKMYRELTGACAAGVDQFIRYSVKNVEKTYTINEIVEMTKNEYGHDRFVRAFE